MNDIADFLRARYAEQRALALAASPGPWQPNAEHDEVIAIDGITVAEGFALSGRQLRATVDHLAAHDPTAVIADLDAKLALVADLDAERHAVVEDCWYTCAAATEERDGGETCDESRLGGPCDCGRDARIDRRLEILARPFARHPDHKGEEWAP
ncbi:DUF6221 family protein [Streptomyces qinglanensis]|uniref:Uncharacterized protein n=1 Tax=Streptomyces qinglanensis TaxID=943816 RepID=A0A1H9U3I9_9ACTN|nr:DUF6221 family protein [Streptomyces qinglanensis]SES03643.1 hypothetical protein SAMN05421870_107256 [Streptomyces qinglanensis]